MRIISGTARRRNIKVPKSVARPTTDRTREALFSMLNEVIEDATCLDVFAGSGALGLEALSRGATSCVFVDADRGSVQAIKANLKDLGLQGGSVRQSDVLSFLDRSVEQFDLVFADPPYVKSAGDRDFVADILSSEKFNELVATDGYFVAEAPAGRVTPAPDGWSIVAERTYGSCGVTVYQKQ